MRNFAKFHENGPKVQKVDFECGGLLGRGIKYPFWGKRVVYTPKNPFARGEARFNSADDVTDVRKVTNSYGNG